MTMFDKMCKVCSRCEETEFEKCFLIKYQDKKILEKLKSDEHIEEYQLCSECIHWQGCHSTIFGECWTCNVNGNTEVQDNDWNSDEGNTIEKCEKYIFGIPHNFTIG